MILSSFIVRPRLLLGFLALAVAGAALARPPLRVSSTSPRCDDGHGKPYCTIQAAIDDAAPGDTVLVGRGDYVAVDGPLAVIDVPLTLRGTGRPVLDGGAYGAGIDTTGIGNDWPRAIVVRSSGVTLEGLTIRNFQGDQITVGGYGIVARGEASWTGGADATFSDLTFRRLRLEDCYYGLRMSRTEGALVAMNQHSVPTGEPGYAIYATLSPAASIRDNVLEQGSVWLAEGSDDGLVMDNVILDAPYNGIWAGIGFSVNTNAPVIVGNRIDGCGEGGIVLWNNGSPPVTGVVIADNVITGCAGGSDDHGGISIYAGEYVDLVIEGNDASANGDDQPGLSFTQSVLTSATVSGNRLTDNPGAGVRFSSSSVGAVVLGNNWIAGNAAGVQRTATSGGVVEATSNWWGDASGPADPIGTVEVPSCSGDPATDLNADGAGDSVDDGVAYCPWLTVPPA